MIALNYAVQGKCHKDKNLIYQTTLNKDSISTLYTTFSVYQRGKMHTHTVYMPYHAYQVIHCTKTVDKPLKIIRISYSIPCLLSVWVNLSKKNHQTETVCLQTHDKTL